MSDAHQNVRVRFAPSPTGDLHIGGLRVALFNWLFARQNKGTFILRIEDTDQKRYKPESVRSIVEGMAWAGLTWDEGPYLKSETGNVEQKGECGPYFQSQRNEIYRAHIKILLQHGSAYHCFCTEERLSQMRTEQEVKKLPPRYDKLCLKLSIHEVEQRLKANTPYVIRLKIPAEGQVEVADSIRGTIKFDLSLVDDQVLMKSDGFPTYHLANVVDDHFMKITHVLRGDDWLSSVPKHILLYRAFGWEQPAFGHLPMILAPDKTRLSKRHGAVSVLAFQDAGYLPEALLNFTLLLGWNPGKGSEQEIFSNEEMLQKFSLAGIQKSPAIFNYEKLKWMNSQYIKNMDLKRLVDLAMPILLKNGLIIPIERQWTTAGGKPVNMQYLEEVLTLARPRLTLINDALVGELDYFFTIPQYDPSLLVSKKANKEGTLHMLQETHSFINKTMDLNLWQGVDKMKTLESIVKRWITEKNYTNSEVLWPLRVALSGREKSPSPFELMATLGKDETLARLQHANGILQNNPSSS